MRFISFLLACCLLSSCWIARGYRIRNLQLTDHDRLPSVPIEKADGPYQFIDATADSRFAPLKEKLDAELDSSLTAAFLVIRNDSILYERYFDDFSQSSLFPSFSIAKSFVSTLIAITIDEGKIRSTQQPVTDYLPELLDADTMWCKVTIQHLLDMRSGVRFREAGQKLDDAIKLGLRPNVKKHAMKIRFEGEPGGPFKYQSVNTEFLALILEKANGKKVSSYLQEKIWQPLGMEYSANWNVDSWRRKNEIAFAGINATARDFAKLGQLYLNEGSWNGKQIVDPKWVRMVNNADSMHRMNGYHNQWWSRNRYKSFDDSLSALAFKKSTRYAGSIWRTSKGFQVSYRTDAFHAAGMLNQYVYVNPVSKVVIVRLGRFWKHPTLKADQFLYELGGGGW